MLLVGAVENLALARGDTDDAARLEGFGSAARASAMSRRRPSEAAVFAHLHAANAAAMSGDRHAALVIEGAALSMDAAARLAAARA